LRRRMAEDVWLKHDFQSRSWKNQNDEASF